MSESADFDPGIWKGHDFRSARVVYSDKVKDDVGGRSHAITRDPSRIWVPESLSTQSTRPLVLLTDHTGSMAKWPEVIFSKLGYLDIEGKSYLGEDMEICFAAIGDVNTDDHSLQVRPFSKGLDLKEQLKNIFPEGKGGGTLEESYELAALYFARNVVMPKAIHPILIFIGDEKPYDMVSVDDAKTYALAEIESRMSAEQIFAELRRKFAVYLIRKPYDTDRADEMSLSNRAVLNRWVQLVGDDHIATLPSADRILDVIFGILGHETGKDDYFLEEITARQSPDQVDTVMKALRTTHRLPSPGGSGRSIIRGGDAGDSAKPLI